MRQQQQKSRNRNRGRKSSSPLSRNLESNGPNVKVRGNASHIAEKYSVLARDAFTNGDTVMAENYFQHAEHYSRIVAAAQQNHAQPGSTGNMQRESGGARVNESSGATSNSNRGNGPQPDLATTPAEATLKEENIVVRESLAEKTDNKQSKEEQPRVRRAVRRMTASKKLSRESSGKHDSSILSRTLPFGDESKPKQQGEQRSEEITSGSN